jgi:type II secretory pathway pseudopilin PulG
MIGSRRGGFTLLNMLIVMTALGVVMAVGTAALVGGFRTQQATSTASNRLAAHTALADRFREDVHRARSVRDSLQEWRTGPACLILQLADDRLVVYTWKATELQRTEQTDADRQAQRVAVGPDCAGVEFIQSEAKPGLITLRLKVARGPGNATRQLDIAAAVGGERR